MKLFLSLFVCAFSFALDIGQVDVGNSKRFTGQFNMEPTAYVHASEHGTNMAMGMADELQRWHSAPVYAKQYTWRYPATDQSIAQALFEALSDTPKVVSLSFGGPTKSTLEEAILISMALLDVVIVASAGNDGGGRKFYPANYPNKCVLSVGTTVKGWRASYSNDADSWLEYNPKDPHGTSSSTARMAAIALQYRRRYPELSCSQIVTMLRKDYGHGMLHR